MRVIHTIARWIGYIACFTTGFMMLLTVADVTCRYFFNSPITGTTEITKMLMIMAIYPALGWAATNRMHVKVTILVDRFRTKIKQVLSIIGLALSFCIYFIMTWRTFLEAGQTKTTSSLIGLPYEPFYWIMVVGLTVFCLSIIVVFIEEIMEVRKS